MALSYSACCRLEGHSMCQMNEPSHRLDVHNTDKNTSKKILIRTGNAEDEHTILHAIQIQEAHYFP